MAATFVMTFKAQQLPYLELQRVKPMVHVLVAV